MFEVPDAGWRCGRRLLSSVPLPVEHAEEEKVLVLVVADVDEHEEVEVEEWFWMSPLSLEYLRIRLRKSLLDFVKTRSLAGSNTRTAFMAATVAATGGAAAGLTVSGAAFKRQV